MLKTFGLSVAVVMTAICAASGMAGAAKLPATSEVAAKPQSKPKTKPGGYCKTLQGKMVGWGQDTVRAQAEKALESEISAWEHRSSFTAKTSDRKTDCHIYIEFLNEYECTAQARVCR